MKKVQLFGWPMVAVMLFFAAGCSDAGLVEPEQGSHDTVLEETQAAKSHPVQMKGQASGSGVFAGAPGDCLVGEMPGLPVSMSGEGIASHLGKITFVQTGHCLSLVNFTYTGSVIVIAANGDEYWSDYAGQSFADGTFRHEGTIVGGTGRFEGATGYYVQEGIGTDPSTGSFTFEMTYEGWILY